MPSAKKPRILIAGGSIAGLALALMLERVGGGSVDFIVLERNADAHPQVGASIAFGGNALRIFDQLGCCDEILEKAGRRMDTVGGLSPDGKLTLDWTGASAKLVERLGYPMIILDRQMVLETLYDHVRDKSKVLMNKRVVSVINSEDCVEVKTDDGCSYTGDILVGADGIYSTVRKEMWRIANEAEPGWTDEEDQNPVSAPYSCMFGISVMNGEIPAGIACNCYKDNRSLAVLTGANNRVYWFYSKAYPTRLYGPDIPRYTDADCDKFAEEHWNDAAQPGITFGDLYKTRVRAVLTPLHSHVFRKWHFGRIITIGDAAHKYLPTGGQGGAAALESAAVLTNHLFAALRADPALSRRPTIPALLARVQAARFARAEHLRKAAEAQLFLEALRNPLCRAVTLHLSPRLGEEVFLQKFTEGVRGAARLEGVEEPARAASGLLGFEDQRERGEAAPWEERRVRDVCAGVVGFLGACVAFGVVLAVVGTGERVVGGGASKGMGPSVVVGGEALAGLGMANATAGFAAARHGHIAAVMEHVVDSSLRTKTDAYFGVMMAAPLTVMLLEGYRASNTLSLLHWPLIWTTLAHFLGFAPILPLYFLTTVITNLRLTPDEDRIKQLPLSRRISPHATRTIIPVVALLHLLPHLLSFLSSTPLPSLLRSPLPAVALTFHLATTPLLPRSRTTYTHPTTTPTASSLARPLALLTALLALAHLALLTALVRSAGVLPSLRAGLDAAPTHVATCAWMVFHGCEVLGRVDGGKKKEKAGEEMGARVARVGAVVVAGFVVAGPGAVVLGGWMWREGVLGGLVGEGEGDEGKAERMD